MKLISTEMGRVVQLFVPEEVRPIKGLYTAELIRLISERYGFGVIPAISETIEKGAKFQQGRLISGNRTINIAELGIHNDGIVVSTMLNTDDADFVLQDIWAWSKEALGTRDQLTKKMKLYESQFVVEFEVEADNALQAFTPVKTGLQHALKETYNYDFPVNLNRITFSIDPVHSFPQLRTEIWIERRLGVPFSQNRYFSACGLPSDKHLQLLEKFESSLKTKK